MATRTAFSDLHCRQTAGGLLIDQNDRVLLGRRSHRKSVAPGCWDIIGGHVETNESIERALSRELYEELGVHPRRYLHLACFVEPDFPHVRHHVFAVLSWDGVPRNCCDEHDEIRWFTIGEVEALENRTPFDFRGLLLSARDR